MKKALELFRVLGMLRHRIRYPVSLPEDIAFALGIPLSNHLSFQDFVKQLTCPQCRPTNLLKFMPREKAEEAFGKALRKERFATNSLFSFYFAKEGWVEFVLQFDEKSRLRRVYLQHKQIPHDQGFEIRLF